MNDLICPILSLSQKASEYMGVNNTLVQCQCNDCAWWDDFNKCCAILTLTIKLRL